MGRASHEPLTVDKARLNLMTAVDELNSGAWLRDHLWQAALAALALGIVAGAVPSARKSMFNVAVWLVKLA